MPHPRVWIDRLWYQGHPAFYLLLPLSGLFALLSACRRLLFRLGWMRSVRLPVPVLVVGNISVGGVGKTPVVMDLVRRLKAAGWTPGVVSRGYGGKAREPMLVGADSDCSLVGDEPVLIAQHAGCVVAVAPRRAEAARLLLEQGVDFIVADDGLQHYALARDFELVLVDARRRHGNGHLLPAGPLREGRWRLQRADLVLLTGDGALAAGELAVSGVLGDAENLLDGERRALRRFDQVHAVAGIGNPEKFFAALEAQGLRLWRHPFPDHHAYTAEDLNWPDQQPVLMTGKDAVKCRALRDGRFWSVEYQAQVPEAAWQCILRRFSPPKKQDHGETDG